MKNNIKIIHEDLNAGGGSERLTITMMEALNEMGFNIDLETISTPDWNQIKKWYGKISLRIKKIKKIDISNVFGSSECTYEKRKKIALEEEEEKYTLIINAHGDILPYYNSTSQRNLKTKIITYCHYPLTPKLINQSSYKKFLLKFLQNSIVDYELDSHLQEKKLLYRVLSTYHLMMKNTIIVTNSQFSKRAIENYYGKVVLSILSPPVDVETYRKVALSNLTRDNTIIVISRYSPDKKIETAIRIARILHKIFKNFKMILIGNIVKDNYDYYRYLQSLISMYRLNEYVKIQLNVPINSVLKLMATSKILLHPTLEEPFGISVAEGMSAGLIPVVPFKGGNTEFVPSRFHFKTEEEAVRIILDAMNISFQDRVKISKFPEIFSVNNFKSNLKILILNILKKEVTISSPQIKNNKIINRN
jgi:glycosyltransferase involved in cell wall biosynthesis